MNKTQEEHSKAQGGKTIEKNRRSFEQFKKQYYFDPDTFFQSFVPEEGLIYLFCGDMQKRIFFISENLKNDFEFPENFVKDFFSVRIEVT